MIGERLNLLVDGLRLGGGAHGGQTEKRQPLSSGQVDWVHGTSDYRSTATAPHSKRASEASAIDQL